MSVWNTITDATATRNGQWITPGRYKFAIHSLTEFPSSKDKAIHWFAIELKVVAASNGTPAGAVLTRLENIKSDIGMNNAKAFAMAIAPDTSAQDVTPDLMQALTGPDQPANGREILAECIPKVSKKGNSYTVINWHLAGSFDQSFTAPAPAPAVPDEAPF